MIFRKNTALVSIIFLNAFFLLYIEESFFPLMPEMGKSFNSSHHQIQLIVPIYYLGLMFTQLTIGLLTKQYGRKPFLIIGLLTCSVGLLMIAMSSHVWQLYIGFLIQALGLGSITPINANIITDVFDDEQSIKKAFSITTIGMGVGSIFAPLIATVIAFNFHWQGSFYFSSFIALIFALINLFSLKETNSNYQKIKVASYFKKACQLLFSFNKKSTSFFPAICFFSGMFQGAFILLFTNVAMILKVQFHQELSQIGLLYAASSISYLIGTMCSNVLSKNYQLKNIIRSALYLTIVNTFLVITRSLYSEHLLLYSESFWFLVHFLLLSLTIGVISPCVFTLALAPFSKSVEHSAEASSAIMFATNGLIFIVGLVAAYLQINNTFVLGITLASLFISAAIYFEVYCRKIVNL